jgi:hypothetical protein
MDMQSGERSTIRYCVQWFDRSRGRWCTPTTDANRRGYDSPVVACSEGIPDILRYAAPTNRPPTRVVRVETIETVVVALGASIEWAEGSTAAAIGDLLLIPITPPGYDLLIALVEAGTNENLAYTAQLMKMFVRHNYEFHAIALYVEADYAAALVEDIERTWPT